MDTGRTTLISAEDALLYARMSTDEAKTLIPIALTVLSDAFDSFVGYSLLEKEYKDIRVSGQGRQLLMLPARNVTAVSSVKYLSGRSGENLIWSALQRDLYEVDPEHRLGVMGVCGFEFGRGVANWLVSFTAGWPLAQIPGTIKERMFYEVKRWCEGRIDVRSENMGGQSSSGASYVDITPDTQKVLRNFMLQGI